MNQKHKNKRRKKHFIICASLLILSALIVLLYSHFFSDSYRLIKELKNVKIPEYIDEQILPLDGSRKGIELKSVKNIVIHYVGNPGTTAQQNHDYFGNDGTVVNSHFIVGLSGEIIQCVPIYERSVATNHRNKDTISVEVCHPDESGRFNNATRESLIKLTAWLLKTCKLEVSDVIRHYDVTGKLCPLYYVEHEDAWEQLLEDIDNYIKNES